LCRAVRATDAPGARPSEWDPFAVVVVAGSAGTVAVCSPVPIGRAVLVEVGDVAVPDAGLGRRLVSGLSAGPLGLRRSRRRCQARRDAAARPLRSGATQ